MCRGGCAGGLLAVAVVGVWKGARPKRRRMHVQQASERERQPRRRLAVCDPVGEAPPQGAWKRYQACV